jgi:hypothetical protein
MDDLRERLDRLSDRMTDGRDAIERLEAARRHRERRRRIEAGALALVVAVGGTFAAVSAIKSGPDTSANGTAVGYEPPAVPYLWPENWARAGTQPQEVQQKVDAGDPSLQWRLDPKEVATQFATNVIGRPEVMLTRISFGSDTKGVVFGLDPCGPGRYCPFIDHPQYIWVRQPAREGPDGVWDVAGAWVGTLDVGIDHDLGPAIDALVAGGALEMDLTGRSDEIVTAGFHMRNGCATFGDTAQQGVDPGLGTGVYSVSLPGQLGPGDDGYGCGSTAAGYAFAYTVPGLTVPVGDPFQEAAGIVAITAMPLLVDLYGVDSQPPTPSHSVDAPVDRLTIACGDSGATVIGSSEVIAQPDGAHVVFDSKTSGVSSLTLPGMGSTGRPGSDELVVDAPPGPQTASCQTAGRKLGSVTFTIVNPDGSWIETPPFEGDNCSTANWEDAPEPQGLADPVEAARDRLGSTFEPGDDLLVVGYPEAEGERNLADVRDGKTVASVEVALGNTGWFASAITTCQ